MTQTMPPDRPKLIMPLIAAVVLGVFAIGYSVLLIGFGLGGLPKGLFAQVLFVGLLGLATTPFFAVYWLRRLRAGKIGNVVWIMAGVMALPTAFWGYMGISFLIEDITYNQSFDVVVFVLLWGPAALSAFLCAAFIWVGRRDRSGPQASRA